MLSRKTRCLREKTIQFDMEQMLKAKMLVTKAEITIFSKKMTSQKMKSSQ